MKVRRIRRTGLYIATALILSVLIVYALVSLSDINNRIAEAESVRSNLSAQVQSLVVQNAALDYQIQHSEDMDMIERVAWTKLGLIQPGEIVYYDIGD